MFHLDIGYCRIGSDICHVNASCTNTSGSYTCACKEGYTGNGTHCAGIESLTYIFILNYSFINNRRYSTYIRNILQLCMHACCQET